MPESSSYSGWRRLFPFRSQWSEINGQRMHYVDQGQGPVLLMVHGNPTWSFYWRHLIEGLQDTFRIVALDHIGCGLSDKPVVYPYSLRTHTENLMHFIERLELTNVTLLAHDWGGAIGLGAATQLPRRFSAFTLFNTGAFPPPRVPMRIAMCRIPLLGKLALRGLNVFPRAALRMAIYNRKRMTPDVRQGILHPYATWSDRIGIERFVRDIPLTTRHSTYRDLRTLEGRLGELSSHPIQLIWGMRDWCFTEDCLSRFTAIYPHAQVHRMDDAGHWVVEDAHERIVPLVREFVSEVQRQ